jgi:hypothetical protein
MKKPIVVSVITALMFLLWGAFTLLNLKTLRTRRNHLLPMDSRSLRERMATIHHLLSEGLGRAAPDGPGGLSAISRE